MTQKIEKMKFYECIGCLAKPGSPQLCASCWQRRDMIEVLNTLIDRENTRTGEGEKCGESIPSNKTIRGIESCQNQKGQCPIHDKKVEIIEKKVNEKGCMVANGIMICYCGKCKPEDYSLPKDFPTATEGWRYEMKEMPLWKWGDLSPADKATLIVFIETVIAQTKEAERARVRGIVEKMPVENESVWRPDLVSREDVLDELN